MLRLLHSVPGLLSALLIIVLGITGAILSVDPALERFGTSRPAGVSVAELAARVARHYPGAEQIERTASGSLIVYYSTDDGARADRVDPVTGKGIAAHVPSAFSRTVKQLHRSLLLDTPGRVATGGAALALLLLCVSGVLLLIKRVGGWRQLPRRLHGNRSQRWHAGVGRVVVAGLLLSALTGAYMSGATLGLLADGMQAEPDFPAATSGGPPAPPARLAALMATDLEHLRELVYPIPGDHSAVYTLRTVQGDGYVDQSSGARLSYRPHGRVRQAYELVYRLHTGEGLWWLGLMLGLSALGAAWLAATGAAVWWQRQRAKPRIAFNSAAQAAQTVILVGSENNSTWGFARVLHDALRKAGQRVHTAPMNQLSSGYGAAANLFVLTATYGDGDAPPRPTSSWRCSGGCRPTARPGSRSSVSATASSRNSASSPGMWTGRWRRADGSACSNWRRSTASRCSSSRAGARWWANGWGSRSNSNMRRPIRARCACACSNASITARRKSNRPSCCASGPPRRTRPARRWRACCRAGACRTSRRATWPA
ncbi:PepSY-associated TM helix domain-containing protein [Massilia glaciei]|uniref:PepSY-associated TM helix domain-containing protein n=1 Tax=Massilia glaciei TaxID=1524097 RepID=UPI0026A24702